MRYYFERPSARIAKSDIGSHHLRLPHQADTDPLPHEETVVRSVLDVVAPALAHSPGVQPRGRRAVERRLDLIGRPGLERAAQPFALRRLQGTLGRDHHAFR